MVWLYASESVGMVLGALLATRLHKTGSLWQAIVPSALLGRAQTSGRVLTWSAIPLGALAGGWAIQWTGNVGLVFGLVGLATI